MELLGSAVFTPSCSTILYPAGSQSDHVLLAADFFYDATQCLYPVLIVLLLRSPSTSSLEIRRRWESERINVSRT